MLSWSAKRRLIYGGGVVFVILVILSGLFFILFRHGPTCSDGKQNGDETGIDCGGSCQKLCTSDALIPVVLWSKIFNVSGDLYSAVAYIENPNINSKNAKATYQFKIFDSNNRLLLSKEGETSIPKGKKFAVFETGIIIKSSKPKSVEFQFTSFSPWQKDTEKEPNISINYGTLTATGTTPRIAGTVSNGSLTTIPEIELTVFVLDSKENVVAASRTFVDELLKGSTQDFVFTWPKPFDLGVEACVSPLDVALVLDKSGSMKKESTSPPEPFSTVKATAENFVKNLASDDRVSVVSFGTTASKESSLTLDKQLAIFAISSLSMSAITLDQTNIADGLTLALNELEHSLGNGDSKKVLILLTDGIPTEPTREGVADYPVTFAESVARDVRTRGVDLYTIGLGKDINEEFLKYIATDDAHYSFAPSKETLSAIYSHISSSLCPKKPNVITVIYRTL